MPEPSGGDAPEGTLLGFDFGLRRIGVAVGQTVTRTVSPLTVVRHGDAPDWDAITALVKEWRPAAVVVGVPLAHDGEDTDMSNRARRFGRQLAGRYGVPVHYADERLTSSAAQAQFTERRAAGRARRRDAATLDAVAAGIILQNWLAQTNEQQCST